mmetsp:Transcript_93/g.188  ORF Transcript_93/g.188 Transcript_93/m.188 type:complete len:629 (+) Transcript_93:53-1939(+)|eukprot:CAMPEP_0172297734 /NCGR_PEP_ID=MMETSP1058-20130122/650_1 /TAXON_ID=83371 /ORGANISM="Detonula confervacea, Strain CCMP 353" /LENGTH=628 /DNA_ID=CAMNT_0013006919 /DNA_START=30 /DNA_END=1916 /DNA_ORIENTATION=+
MSSTESFDVSEGAAYAVLYTVLSVFTILAIITGGYCGGSKILSKLGCIMKSMAGGAEGEEEDGKGGGSADFFLAARSSAGARAIALSFFASGMGAWVVYGSTEMGANPNLSWFGVLGYSGASAMPALIVCFIGPRVRAITGEKAFATTDFGLVRYGRLMQLSIAAISVFYMWIFLVSEMTSISNVYGLMVGLDTFSDTTIRYTTSIAVSLAVFTWFYTSIAGLPASIVTDKFQAGLMFSLVLILLIVACSNPANQVTKEEFSVASQWTTDGLTAAVTLFIAIACAELFNQGTWQRVWAAKTVKDMRIGFAVGSFLVFLLMMFFGIMGMLAYANDPTSYDNYEKFAYLAFFDLILPLHTFWHVITLIVVTALAASSIDTLQTGIASVFSSDLLRLGLSDRYALLVSRVLLIFINIPAVIMSSQRYDVIMLFLVADLVCATAVFPVFLGLITEDKHWLIPAPTELGAFLGIWSGIIAVLVNGQIIDFTSATNFITGETIATGPWSYFWLTNDPECAVCGTKTMMTFIIVPLVAGFFTLFFSKIDILIRGERARKPIFMTAQPEVEAENYDLTKKEEEEQKLIEEEEPKVKEEADGTSEENEDVRDEHAKDDGEADPVSDSIGTEPIEIPA